MISSWLCLGDTRVFVEPIYHTSFGNKNEKKRHFILADVINNIYMNNNFLKLCLIWWWSSSCPSNLGFSKENTKKGTLLSWILKVKGKAEGLKV